MDGGTARTLKFPDGSELSLDRPAIVGVLNVTPDSFSDGGAHQQVDAAVEHARRLAEDGADVIDIGGESTRPGARRIPAAEQLRRIVPVIESLRAAGLRVPLSVDTTLGTVARAALDAGASMVNDISAGREDSDIFAMVAQRGAPMVLMHMRGQPATMQQSPQYEDVVSEVLEFLLSRIAAAEAAGVPGGQIIIDPGIGFGKTHDHNLSLLANLHRFVETGYPVMLGASRKRFLGTITGEAEPIRRDTATAATTALGVAAGVRLLRVHEVRMNRQAADVAFAIASRSAPSGAKL